MRGPLTIVLASVLLLGTAFSGEAQAQRKNVVVEMMKGPMAPRLRIVIQKSLARGGFVVVPDKKLAAVEADLGLIKVSDSYTAIGHGAMPVIIFLVVAVIFHIALRYTKYGKYTYAIGGNMQAARTSGINVKRHLVIVYSIAGLLAGLAGVVASARAATGQAGMGMSYELDAIAAAVIGGTSLAGGVGRITGTVIGALILGVMASGFTFVGVDAYIQDIIKGLIIVVAVVIDQYRNKRKLKR